MLASAPCLVRLGGRRRKSSSSTFARSLRLLIPAATAIFVAHAAPVAAATGETIAIVGNEVITTDEFAAFVQRYVRQKLYHGGSKETMRRVAVDALETLIDEHLLAIAAERRGIKGDTAGVARQIDDFRKRYSKSGRWAEIEKRLPTIEAALLLNSRIEELRRVVSKVGKPSEANLRAFYKEKQKLFTQPAAYDVDMILIRVPPSALKPEWDAANARATEVERALKGGADFAALAREHSNDPSGKKGGALGRIHKGQLPDAAHDEIGRLAPGQVSSAIRILEGFLILRLNQRYEAQLQPFAKVRERAEGLYRRDRAKVQWDAYLKQLRKETKVQKFKVKAHVEAMFPGK